MKHRWPLTLAFASLLTIPATSQAGFLEDLLARPAIQALLGRQPALQTTVKNCLDAQYRQRNLATCEQAEQASRLAAMPAELRAVMAVPASSASMRELCVMAQTTTVKDSYLCAELFKADAGFKTMIDRDRAMADEKKRLDALRTNAEGNR